MENCKKRPDFLYFHNLIGLQQKQVYSLFPDSYNYKNTYQQQTLDFTIPESTGTAADNMANNYELHALKGR